MAITSVVPVVLCPSTPLTNADVAYITAVAGQTIVKTAVVTNITGGAVTFDMWRVPDAGVSANSNLLISTQSVPAKGRYPCFELVNMVLLEGETIHIQASANSSLNFTASGWLSS